MRRIHLLYSKNSFYWILWGLLLYPGWYSAIAHTPSDNWSWSRPQTQIAGNVCWKLWCAQKDQQYLHPSIQSRALPDTFLAATGITLREKGEKIRILFAKPVQLLAKWLQKVVLFSKIRFKVCALSCLKLTVAAFISIRNISPCNAANESGNLQNFI